MVHFLERISRLLNRVLIVTSGVFLTSMIILICLNIVMRVVWVPVAGTFELVGFFGAVLTAFALGFTQIRKGHIAVDVVISLFSERTQRLLTILNSALCMGFFGLAAWRLTKWSTTILKSGEVTETLRIVFYPFSYAVALGCGVLGLVCLTELLQAVFPRRESQP